MLSSEKEKEAKVKKEADTWELGLRKGLRKIKWVQLILSIEKSHLRINFHSTDIHFLFLLSSLFSKIIKYILYNTQGKSKDIYFFTSQDEF